MLFPSLMYINSFSFACETDLVVCIYELTKFREMKIMSVVMSECMPKLCIWHAIFLERKLDLQLLTISLNALLLLLIYSFLVVAIYLKMDTFS